MYMYMYMYIYIYIYVYIYMYNSSYAYAFLALLSTAFQVGTIAALLAAPPIVEVLYYCLL
jgi:hypothetical protein